MKKAAVVGGAGFIGSHVVDQLVKLNVETIVIDNLSTGNKNNISKYATFYNIDILNKAIQYLNKHEEGNV